MPATETPGREAVRRSGRPGARAQSRAYLVRFDELGASGFAVQNDALVTRLAMRRSREREREKEREMARARARHAGQRAERVAQNARRTSLARPRRAGGASAADLARLGAGAADLLARLAELRALGRRGRGRGRRRIRCAHGQTGGGGGREPELACRVSSLSAPLRVRSVVEGIRVWSKLPIASYADRGTMAGMAEKEPVTRTLERV